MSPSDMLYHGDPDDCTHDARSAAVFDPATGLCIGHRIPRTPSRCACHSNGDDACTARATDPDEAPYCTACHTVRVLGISGRDCQHCDPE